MSVETWEGGEGEVGRCVSTDRDAQRILGAAIAILRQGEELLRAVTPEIYVQKVPAVFNASMGGHLRHTLDHFACALQAVEGRGIDYDARDRDRRVETDRDWALVVIRSLRCKIEGLSGPGLDAAVTVRCEVSYGEGVGPETTSSLGRELAYSIVHAIHHYALIAVMARLLDVTLSPHFGMAPSTMAHQQKQGVA